MRLARLLPLFVILLIVSTLLLVLHAPPGGGQATSAQTNADATYVTADDHVRRVVGDLAHLDKMSGHLSQLAEAARQAQLQGETITSETADLLPKDLRDLVAASLMRMTSRGEVNVVLAVDPQASQLTAPLAGLGMLIDRVDSGRGQLKARVPILQLERVAAMANVRQLRLPSYGFTSSGSILTEGDSILNADDVRSVFGVDGTGVKVGVISDGVEGLTDAQASGELPASVDYTTCNMVPNANLEPGETNDPTEPDLAGAEGTAMLEIVNDLAPGAELWFGYYGFHLKNYGTSLDFSAAVDCLAQHVDVVVDDIGFLRDGPYDGNSPVSQNTADALNNPAWPVRTYTTAVGNLADSHYEESYEDSGYNLEDLPDFWSVHNFCQTSNTTCATNAGISCPCNPYDRLVLQPGEVVGIFLQWNDTWGSSANNYDLFVGLEDSVYYCSNDVQDGDDDPLEWCGYKNETASDQMVDIYIGNYKDTAAVRTFDIFLSCSGCYLLSNNAVHNFNTERSSVANQADASGGVMSAGAIDQANPGHDDIEWFSSRGPTNDGRLKPDGTAIDGVCVTGAGGFGEGSCQTTGKQFYGTSAASPHIGGLAALLLDCRPDLGAGEPGDDPAADRSTLRAAILDNAVDLGAAGADNTFGYGRLDAYAAADAIGCGLPEADLTITKSDDSDPVCSEGDLTYHLEVCNIGGATATGVTLDDELPPEVSFVSASPDICTHTDGVHCELPDLAAPECYQLDLLVLAPHVDSPTVVTNQAVCDAENEPAENSDNNTCSEDTTIQPPPAFPTTWTEPGPLNSNAGTNTGADVRPELATDGAGSWVAVWDSSDSLGGTIGDDGDILMSRSSDDGATWTPPVPLNSSAASDSSDHHDNRADIATDGRGNWVVVWQKGAFTTWGLRMSRSTDNGLSWTDERVLYTRPDGSRPRLAVDDEGHWILVFQGTGQPDIWFPGDVVYGPDQDIFAKRSYDNGASWTAPQPVNSNAVNDYKVVDYTRHHYWDGYPDVAIDGSGNVVVVWISRNDGLGFDNVLEVPIGSDKDILMARSANGGITWSPPTVLNGYAAVDSAWEDDAHVAADGFGNWVTAWRSTYSLNGAIGSDTDILVARSTDHVSWTYPAPLNSYAGSDSGADGGPVVEADGCGNWLAAWDSYDDLDGSIGTDPDIITAHSIDDGITWSTALPLNANASVDTGDDEDASIATDQWGHWVAVWESTDTLGGTIGTDKDLLIAHSPADSDGDGDTISDTNDNCPLIANADQTDTDGDTVGDACDPDDDDDTIPDGEDSDPLDEFACQDLDADTCDDCSVLGQPDVAQDGVDTDSDGLCDAGDGDDDNDGLADEVDLNPLVVSAVFSDEALGGETFGEVLDTGGLTVEVSEQPDPAGVRIMVSGSGGPATASVCGIVTIELDGADHLGVTCASASIEVVTGGVKARFGPFTASLPQDTTATIEELAAGCFAISNSAASSAPISVNGRQIPPGGSESDDDADGFFTSVEQYLGTDPLDNCPDVHGSPGLCPGPTCDGDDAWPPDLDVNAFVDVVDVLKFKGNLLKHSGEPGYIQRLDLYADGFIDIVDVLKLKPVIITHCTNP